MATFKYFADIDGEVIELTRIWHDGHISSKAAHFTGLLPNGTRVAATRKVPAERLEESEAAELASREQAMYDRAHVDPKEYSRWLDSRV